MSTLTPVATPPEAVAGALPAWRIPGSGRTLRRLAVGGGSVLIAVLHLVNINGWPVFGDDEGTYVAQAWSVLNGNLAHYTYWYDHPPAGWIQLAIFQWLPSLFGSTPTVASTRIIMVAFTIASALLVRRLSLNLGAGEMPALAAMLLWGANPLVAYESRQVLLDNLALPWLLAGFVLVTSAGRQLSSQLAGGICFALGVLTKETTLVLAPAFLLALWTYAYRPTRSFAVMGTTVIIGLTGFAYPLFAMLRGELLPGEGHVSLLEGVVFQLGGRAGSGVMWDSTSAARGVVMSWFAHDWVLPAVGAVAGLCCLTWRSMRPIGVAIAILVLMALRPGGYLPAMFIIVALPFCAIAIAAVGGRLAARCATWRWRGVGVGRPVAAVLLCAAITSSVAAWAPRHSVAMTARSNDSHSAALEFVTATLPRTTRIVVDDSYWTNLVAAGWSSDGWSGAIWHFKLDLDPIAGARELPGGWADVDYLIESEAVRLSVQSPDAAKLREAWRHSVVIAQWGTGDNLVAVREIHPDMVLPEEGAR